MTIGDNVRHVCTVCLFHGRLCNSYLTGNGRINTFPFPSFGLVKFFQLERERERERERKCFTNFCVSREIGIEGI